MDDNITPYIGTEYTCYIIKKCAPYCNVFGDMTPRICQVFKIKFDVILTVHRR